MHTDPDITVRMPTPADVNDDWTDPYFRPSTEPCTYWPAIGGALVVYGARDPGGPGQWHTCASGQWLRVDGVPLATGRLYRLGHHHRALLRAGLVALRTSWCSRFFEAYALLPGFPGGGSANGTWR